MCIDLAFEFYSSKVVSNSKEVRKTLIKEEDLLITLARVLAKENVLMGNNDNEVNESDSQDNAD